MLISSAAEADLAEAYAWYEQPQTGLGGRFLEATDQAMSNIHEHPARYPIVHAGLRRVLLRRFPYAVFYQLRSYVILVVAVLHAARDRRTLDGR